MILIEVNYCISVLVPQMSIKAIVESYCLIGHMIKILVKHLQSGSNILFVTDILHEVMYLQIYHPYY